MTPSQLLAILGTVFADVEGFMGGKAVCVSLGKETVSGYTFEQNLTVSRNAAGKIQATIDFLQA